MARTINSFEEGTPAWRVFFPVLVTGWETLRPVLLSWDMAPPAVLDSNTTIEAVSMLRGLDPTPRLSQARLKASLREIRAAEVEAEAVEHLRISWVELATWAGRYEQRRRRGDDVSFWWLKAAGAYEALQGDLETYGPVLRK